MRLRRGRRVVGAGAERMEQPGVPVDHTTVSKSQRVSTKQRRRVGAKQSPPLSVKQRLQVAGSRVGRWSPFKWALAVVVLAMLDGLVGALVGVVIGVELLLVGTPRRLLALSVPCFAAVLLENLVRGLPAESQVSAAWVADNLLANHLAFAGFAFLVTGLLLPERTALRSERPPPA